MHCRYGPHFVIYALVVYTLVVHLQGPTRHMRRINRVVWHADRPLRKHCGMILQAFKLVSTMCLVLCVWRE